jgi:hypothetical protein
MQIQDGAAPVEFGEYRFELRIGDGPIEDAGVIVTSTMPNSSIARPISAMAVLMWGIGVAANARKRSGCDDTSAAYSSVT